MRKKQYSKLSLLCLIISVISWVPNVVFDIASPFWLMTFIIPPIGIVFAVLAKNYWLVAANIIMVFSFYILKALGHVLNS
ncbi:hypothetical protein GMD78_20245 [Ornithinibacillus sp. L9]|uniref:Uncharacterized protein n=1 Tax=Ornithinibacillus caprae TaxID=2678566 RepID=A0A6N8FM24_9BACI|nr:hypothetical protein [Ornithinibacillus caprae]MUK90690.1 hypothetical protein [Ornithinibacillus caprae]